MTRRKPKELRWMENRRWWAIVSPHTGMTQSEMVHYVMRKGKRRMHRLERREGKGQARQR